MPRQDNSARLWQMSRGRVSAWARQQPLKLSSTRCCRTASRSSRTAAPLPQLTHHSTSDPNRTRCAWLNGYGSTAVFRDSGFYDLWPSPGSDAADPRWEVIRFLGRMKSERKKAIDDIGQRGSGSPADAADRLSNRDGAEAQARGSDTDPVDRTDAPRGGLVEDVAAGATDAQLHTVNTGSEHIYSEHIRPDDSPTE